MRRSMIILTSMLMLMVMAVPAFAGEAATVAGVDSGDTAWLLISTALVMLMTPGLAFFYAGMVRRKNVLGTIMHSFIMLCAISIVWILWGYTLAFGGDVGGFIGDLSMLGLKGVGTEASGTIPHLLFMMFQGMFAVITPALISGAYAERIKFSSMLVFSILWVTFVYSPVCHWVWGGGWMAEMGTLDFAGGNVVHINAGVAGLVLALFLGKRQGYGKEVMFPSSVSLTALGAALLWFGWFGFNAGSQLAADGLAASAFLVTNTSAATGALAWMFAEWIIRKKPTVLGIASGVVAGLVAITPAAGFVNLQASLLIGLVAGFLGYFSVTILKNKLGYDDSLDAFGVHGMCGMWGALATGLFANPLINEGAKGLLYGNPPQLWIQLLSVIATIAFSAIGTLIVILVTTLLTSGIRVHKDHEMIGLDRALHGERAFEIT